jgi:hypothetical protein
MDYVKQLHANYIAAQAEGKTYPLTDRETNRLAGLFLEESMTPNEYSITRALGEDPDQVLIDVAFAMVRNPVYIRTAPTNAGLSKYFHQAVKWHLLKLKDRADPNWQEKAHGEPVSPQDPIGSKPIPELVNLVDENFDLEESTGDNLLRHANFLESMDLLLSKYGAQHALAYFFRCFGYSNKELLVHFSTHSPNGILLFVERRLRQRYPLFETGFLRRMIPAPGTACHISLDTADLSRAVYNMRTDLEMLHARKTCHPTAA